jgi:hypothetical protein
VLANRRLTVRYERHADLLIAFLHLACALICARKLRPLCNHLLAPPAGCGARGGRCRARSAAECGPGRRRLRKRWFLASFALHRWRDSPRIGRTADYRLRWRAQDLC